MMRAVVLLAIGQFAIGCSRARETGSADTASAKCDHSLPTDTVGRPEYAPARELLEIMAGDARVNPDARQDIRFRAPERLLRYVSDSGLIYVDVNGVVGEESGDTIAHVTVDSMRAELRAQRGNLYSHFQSLAKLYADSTTAYYRIQYCPLAGGFIAVFGHGDYTLAFRRQGGRLRLTRFAALEVAAD